MIKALHSFACLALFCLYSAANAGVVYFQESHQFSTKAGDIFVLHVWGKDFPVGVDGGGLDIAFESTMLQVDLVTVDPLWNDIFDNGVADNLAGNVTNIYFNDFSMQGVSGDFPLLTLQLSAVKEGTSLVELKPSDKYDFAGGGSALPVEFSKIQVNILAVPEPSTHASLLAGLALLAVLAAIAGPSRA